MSSTLPFPSNQDLRASFALGTLYAVDGGDGHIYFGQVSARKTFAFYRFREMNTHAATDAVLHPVMSRFFVSHPSVGAALRAGKWRRLERHPLPPSLLIPAPTVMWPWFTSTVTVNLHQEKQGGPTYETSIDDPAIQDMEISAVWDAAHHVPKRLRLDFGDADPESWHVGGPVWRQRRFAVEMGRRDPNGPDARRAATALLPPLH